jgi:drug/metabolite transporter (DMT)-like permease
MQVALLGDDQERPQQPEIEIHASTVSLTPPSVLDGIERACHLSWSMTPRQASVLALQALCWGSAYIFISSALEEFSPMVIVVGRCVIATLVLSGYLKLTGGSLRALVADVRRRPGAAAALSITGGIIPFTLIAVCQQYVPAGLTGVLMASVPLWTALFALRLDADETIGPRQGVGLLLGLAGVMLVVGLDAVTTLSEALGVAGVLAAAGCYALQTFVVKRHYSAVAPVGRGVLLLAVTTIVTLPLGATGSIHHLTLVPVLSLLGVSVIGTSLGLMLQLWLIDELGPSRAALTTYLAPGFSLILAAIFLGEAIAVTAALGLGLIIVGVLVGSRARERVPEIAEPVVAVAVVPTVAARRVIVDTAA